MPSLKRSFSISSASSSGPSDDSPANKSAKLSNIAPPKPIRTVFDRADDAEKEVAECKERIEDLEAQITNSNILVKSLEAQSMTLLEFIGKQNLQNPPSSIQHMLKNFPAKQTTLSIRAAIDTDYASLQYKPEDYHSLGLIHHIIHNADKVSAHVAKYLPRIKQLSSMAEGGPEEAFNLLLYLASQSYMTTDKGEVLGIKCRKSDGPADELLFSICKRMKEENPAFKPIAEFQSLNKQRKRFVLSDPESANDRRLKRLFVYEGADDRPISDYDSFFPKSYQLMWSYISGPEAVECYARELKSEIHEIHTTSREKAPQKAAFEHTSYRLTKQLQPFVQAIRRLSYMAGGLRLAFKLVLYLGSCSYTQMASVCGGYNYRPTDTLADSLCVELAKLIKAEDRTFYPAEAIEDLRKETEYLSGRGIKTYFLRSYKLFESWAPDAKTKAKQKQAQMSLLKSETVRAMAKRDTITDKVTKFSKEKTRRLEPTAYCTKMPSSDWLSIGIQVFLPEIEELSEMREGLLPAIEAILFLGKHSFTTLPDIGPTYSWPEPYPRPSDAKADELLGKFLTQAWENGFLEGDFVKKETEELKAQKEYLGSFGINGYMENSYSLALRFLSSTI